MEQNLNNKKWLKNKKWWFISGTVIVLLVGFIFMRGNGEQVYETMKAQRSDLIQEVSVTGKIKPAQAVDLQFENSGRIVAINYKVGDKVNLGAVIASLENQDLQASVNSAKADLEKTIRNYKSLADSTVASSLRVELENAKSNLEQVIKKADGDLANKYNSAYNTLNESITQIDNSATVLEYIRRTYYEGKYSWDDDIKRLQEETSAQVVIAKKVLAQINFIGSAIDPISYNKVDTSLRELLVGYQHIRSALNFVQESIKGNSSLVSSSTDRASINTESASIAADLSLLSDAIQDITDQKITNAKNISDAKSKLATAEAAFPTLEDIIQKESALLSAQAQLRKSLIIAPFAGIIGKIDVEKGQTVNSSTIIVSLVSANHYQIEANITEVDISKVQMGNPAMLTLDAYGSQTKFNAKVASIDTAATVVEGVTTYKTVFDFEGTVDPGVRPNMTANIDIETAKKISVISIPQRAVISRNGIKFVKIFHGKDLPVEEKSVEIGMSGKNGFVEIISGISEGDEIITFVNE